MKFKIWIEEFSSKKEKLLNVFSNKFLVLAHWMENPKSKYNPSCDPFPKSVSFHLILVAQYFGLFLLFF